MAWKVFTQKNGQLGVYANQKERNRAKARRAWERMTPEQRANYYAVKRATYLRKKQMNQVATDGDDV